MNEEEYKELLDSAHEAGANDTITAEHLSEGALLFISTDVPEQLTDEQQEEVIEAYHQGFKEGI